MTLVVFHDGREHDRWKAAFDAHEDRPAIARRDRAAGHRHATLEGRVVVHLYFPNSDAARGFMDDPSLPAAMESAGIVGEHWLALFGRTETRTYTPGDVGVTLTVHHAVGGFAIRKAVFDEHEVVPRSNGALGHRVVRRLDDLRIVVAAIDFSSIDAAEALGADTTLADAMAGGGVEGVPASRMSTHGERRV